MLQDHWDFYFGRILCQQTEGAGERRSSQGDHRRASTCLGTRSEFILLRHVCPPLFPLPCSGLPSSLLPHSPPLVRCSALTLLVLLGGGSAGICTCGDSPVSLIILDALYSRFMKKEEEK